MSPEMELAGLPVTFASTKVTKKKVNSSAERNRKKKAQKKRKNKQKNKDCDDRNAEFFEEVVDHFNYAEEFKIKEVLTEYKRPFTILMPKQERYKSEDDEEEGEEEVFECEEVECVQYDVSCDLDYGFETDTVTSTVVAVEDTVDSTVDTIAATVEDVIDVPGTCASTTPSKKKNDPLQKYYQQRYDYFSLFDHGIQIDTEGWYSVTPEIIAEHIASEAHAIALTNRTDNQGELVVVDAFCGVGGNTIQFARYFDRVVAIDLDLGRLEMARNNAEVYGVADKITFIHGDVFEVLKPGGLGVSTHVDLVFMSPPWGGPDYVNQPVFCPRRDILDNRGEVLFSLGRAISPNLILFLPRQSDVAVIAEMVSNTENVKEEDSFVVEQHWLRNRIKAISIYFYS